MCWNNIHNVQEPPHSAEHLPLALEANDLYLLATAQAPISIFFAGPVGEISISKMSMGRPRVIQAFGI